MPGYGRNNVMRKSATAAANKEVSLTLVKPEPAMRTFVQAIYVGLGGKGTVGSALLEIEDGMILPGETAEENKLILPTGGAFGMQELAVGYQGGPGKAVKITLAAAGTEVVGYLTAVFYID